MMGSLNELGEFGLIHLLTQNLQSSKELVLGVGDDCAVIHASKEYFLISCDAFIEDVHFRKCWARAEDIGYKAAAAALSDIAAMGGVAKYMLITLACPGNTETYYLECLYDGIREVCDPEGISIIGGDTTSSPHSLVLNMVVIGSSAIRPVYRSGAQPGDVVIVTGHPGSAALGLHALEQGQREEAEGLVRSQLRPRPRLREGAYLAGTNKTHSMIDISDGILQDLSHIATRSGVSIAVDTTRLPLSDDQKHYAHRSGVSAQAAALSGGEDYELAFTVSADYAEALLYNFSYYFTTQLTIIGEVRPGPASIIVDGKAHAAEGFDHFHGLK
ncbi:MAG: thiamine-phosphate kinase [Candidatus Hydrogenedentales bacterium]